VRKDSKRRTSSSTAPGARPKKQHRYGGPRPPHLAGQVLGGYRVEERLWPQADRRSRYRVACVRCKAEGVQLGPVLVARERAGRSECPACRVRRAEGSLARTRVKRLLKAHPKLATKELARRAGVSDTYVYYVRDGKR
jgi:hypothetical protein